MVAGAHGNIEGERIYQGIGDPMGYMRAGLREILENKISDTFDRILLH